MQSLEDDIRDVYRACFSSESGQVVLRDLAKFCNFYNAIASEQPCTMAFEEGKRRVFLRILAFLRSEKHSLKDFLGEEKHVF